MFHNPGPNSRRTGTGDLSRSGQRDLFTVLSLYVSVVSKRLGSEKYYTVIMDSNLSFKEILEKVDWFSIAQTEVKMPEEKPPVVLPPLDDTEFAVMSMEQFLEENEINLNDNEEEEEEELIDDVTSEPNSDDLGSDGTGSKKKELSFLYAESKRSKQERERQLERERLLQRGRLFRQEDLSLATVPGYDFDPTTRSFSIEELRPQPIIRKRKKQYVADDNKDVKYWSRRLKNNVAARRSREARRLKENQIALRGSFLEQENVALKAKIQGVTEENYVLKQEGKLLRERLRAYNVT